MGYDVELVQIPGQPDTAFPVEPGKAGKLRGEAAPFADLGKARELLLGMTGCKPGPGESVDFLGKGLSYARLTVRKDAIHVENNASPRDLLTIHKELKNHWPDLRIYDLQSGQLHSAASFQAWWSRPL